MSGPERTFEWTEFWYQNPSKIDSFFSQLHGRLEGERKESVSKSVGGGGKLGFEVGGLLAALGLAKGTAEAELHGDYGRIVEVTTSLSTDNKLLFMLSFLEREGQLASVRLFERSAGELVDVVRGSRFQLFMGGFNYIERHGNEPELRSALLADDKPAVRVPLLDVNHLPSQTINVVSEGETFAHHVFCTTMIRADSLLASPIAIWFPHVDPDSFLVRWWWGKETTTLDERGIPID